QRQVQNAASILRDMPDCERQRLFKFVNWEMVKQFYHIVVAADAEPNERFDHRECPGISLQTIKARLRDNHYASPRKLWQACKDRKWLTGLMESERSYKAITVGDVTYELPVLVQLNSQENT